MRTVEPDERYIDEDRYEEQGHIITLDGRDQEIVDDPIDAVIARAEEYDGLVQVRSQYLDRHSNEVHQSDIVWCTDE